MNGIRRPLFFMLVLVALAMTPLIAQAGTAEFTNSTPADLDSAVASRTVSVGVSSELPAGATLSNVSIAINFLKTDGTCAVPATGNAFHNETAFWLVSPTGTTVSLVSLDTFTSGASGTPVTVVFDDSASAVVGGAAPVSGTFRPVSPLSAFNGESPHGTWTLYLQDSTPGDPLCFYSYTLRLTAEAGAGCEQFLPIDADSVVGRFVVDTPVYFAPGQVAPGYTITAGSAYWVLGMDAAGQYHKIILQCKEVWVPVNTVGPNYDEVWNGRPLPTKVVG